MNPDTLFLVGFYYGHGMTFDQLVHWLELSEAERVEAEDYLIQAYGSIDQNQAQPVAA